MLQKQIVTVALTESGTGVTKSGQLAVFGNKVFGNITTLTHLCIDCSCFCVTREELNNCDKGCLACKS